MTCSRYLPQQYRSFCGYLDDMELVFNSLKSQLSKIIDNKKYTKICIYPYGSLGRKVNDKFCERLLPKLKENDIQFFYHKFASGEGDWSFCGSKDHVQLSKAEALQSYQKCGFKICMTLENCLISRCSRATVAHFCQHFFSNKTDFINVRSSCLSAYIIKSYIKKTYSKKGNV